LKITIFNGKIHYNLPFSIAMLNYQRVHLSKGFQDLGFSVTAPVPLIKNTPPRLPFLGDINKTPVPNKNGSSPFLLAKQICWLVEHSRTNIFAGVAHISPQFLLVKIHCFLINLQFV
jgi:hypothetical protein